ncbi:MAG: tetratricopeptide repeat protein [Chloroflexaceae bacterium]|nr:tetratricopeptide repeat protein [Chloroflexaceae bacterium]
MVGTRVTSEFIQQTRTRQGESLLTTRLSPPRQPTRMLHRERVETLLRGAADFPLTLVVAPAGSGKTVALADFAGRDRFPTVWCRMVADDDPLSVVYHLVAACRVAELIDDVACRRVISGTATGREGGAATGLSPRAILDTLVNELAAALLEDTLLILDDYHQVDQQPEVRDIIERMIGIQPRQLHVVLSTRYRPQLEMLPIVLARGEVLQVDQQDLALTSEETNALFDLYEHTPRLDGARVTTICRGWPLVLQLLASGQYVATNEGQTVAQEVLEPAPPLPHTSYPFSSCKRILSLIPSLAEYLTRQVFDEQPPDIQTFLLRTAGLRWVDQEVCQALPGLAPVASCQEWVERRCLFLHPLQPGRFAYQPLFKSFLEYLERERLADWREHHRQAAGYYQQQEDYEGVVYHWMAMGEEAQAARVLEQVAAEWLRQGRAATLLSWLDLLPASQQQRPVLLEVRAGCCHRLDRFDQALEIYRRAEEAFRQQGDLEGQARTLRGRAEVYLDTVQPAPAEALLKQALKLLPKDRHIERAEILLLQAENWTNRGRADVAFYLETSARHLVRESRQGAAGEAGVAAEAGKDETTQAMTDTLSLLPTLPPRLLLRSGRLNESRHLLEAQLGVGAPSIQQKGPTTLAHREPLLLLALIYAMLGNGARAFAMALRGLLEALQGGSRLTEAIAHMRVGHAHQVITPIGAEAAKQHYHQAMALIEEFGVTRTKVEGCMGLALLYGHSGDLVAAEAVAREGLEVAESTGDEWIAGMTWLALGSAAVAAGDERATEWLQQAYQRFVRGSDTYGQAMVSLWRALWYLHTGHEKEVDQYVAHLLELTQKYGYEGLLTSQTLFGPRDMAMLIPLLLRGRAHPATKLLAQQLLRQAFPTVATDDTVVSYHPGYTLRIQMLGTFRVWRGASEIQAREWQREKARQLLQLLLTYRGQWLQREQICSWLWPDSDLEAAERQFKVTLNALNTALEPFRPPRTTPFFVRRQGLAYSFAPSYGCWIDVDEFELRTTNVPQGEPDIVLRNFQVAVDLYTGDYLAESLYDSWTLEERERLLARYLATATTLARMLLTKGDTQQAVYVCERVLRRDRCYEEAYQILMATYARSGSRSQALRSYSRCVQALHDDLGMEPLPETTELYEHIKRNEAV